MKNLSVPVLMGFLFSAVGLVALILSGEVLTAAIWLSFGNGLIVSSLRFRQVDEQGQTFYAPIPKARLYTGLFLIVLAIVLLFIQILADFQATDTIPAG